MDVLFGKNIVGVNVFQGRELQTMYVENLDTYKPHRDTKFRHLLFLCNYNVT